MFPQPKPRPKLLDKRAEKAAERSHWMRVRREVLDRDNHRCRACGQSHGLDVHHVVMRSLGGSDDATNLIALCCGPGGCHRSVHGHILKLIVMNPEHPQKGLRFEWVR